MKLTQDLILFGMLPISFIVGMALGYLAAIVFKKSDENLT